MPRHSKHHTSVERLYSEGRTHPYGRNTDHGAHHPVHHAPDMRPADEHYCQDPADHHDAHYNNDASGWVRGARGEPNCNNEIGENKPGYDDNPVWKMANKGNDWRRRK